MPFLESNARYKGLYGGRGSMKSHGMCEASIELSLMREGFRCVYIREVQKTLEHSSKMLLEDKIKLYGLEDRFECKDTWIENDLGGLFIFNGMQNHNADSIKSLEGFDLAVIDEAQRLSQTSWDLLYPTIRRPGSGIWCAWNPDQPTDPVDKFFRGPDAKHDPDIFSLEMNWTHNPWFKKSPMYNDMRRDMRRDPDKYKWIWGGGYQINSVARVFKNWRVDDVPTPDEKTFILAGADFGFSVDPTVIVIGYIHGNKLMIWREAYKVGCEIIHTPLLFDQCTPTPGMMRNWTIIADSARPETISHLQKHGYPLVLPSIKGAGSVKEGIEFLKNYDIIVDPSCLHTIDELTLYQYKIDPRTGLVSRELSDKKNHVIDALRYAVEPLRRPRGGLV